MKTLVPILALTLLSGLSISSLRPGPGAAPRAAPAETYEVDPVHSTVVFQTTHVGISQAYGRFDRISKDKSRVVYDPADPSKSSVLVVVEADSIDTNEPKRDQHLKSPDFFSAKEYPEIVFESQKIGAQGQELEVSGELTLHGVTKPIQAQVKKIGQGEVAMFQDYRAGFVAEFTVDMRDFGFDFVKKNPGAVGPEVRVTVSLECVRK